MMKILSYARIPRHARQRNQRKIRKSRMATMMRIPRHVRKPKARKERSTKMKATPRTMRRPTTSQRRLRKLRRKQMHRKHTLVPLLNPLTLKIQLHGWKQRRPQPQVR